MKDNIIRLTDIVKMSDSEEIEEDQELNFIDKKNTISDYPCGHNADKHEKSKAASISKEEDANDNKRIANKEFEEALERVIKKMFAHKIDIILERVIQDVVEKEITILKQTLTQ